MSLFHSILANIKKHIDRETGEREAIARIATEILGVTVTEDMVVRNKTDVRIKVSPTVRTALAIKRQKLVLALQKEGISILSVN